jgi:Xaa-Pro aminopeptidase
MNKLAQLRALMKEKCIDAYIIPRGDEYLGEFVAPYAERLKYLTGFTGSAGHAVILQDKAFVMSDGRYTIQLAQQIDASLLIALDSTKNPLKDWLYDQLSEGKVMGFDPALHSIDQIESLQKRLEAKKITLKPVAENLIDQIWLDQPEMPNREIISFPDHIAGQTSQQKIDSICAVLAEQGAEAAILTLPDSVSWLMNIRSKNREYTPAAQTYAYIDVKAKTVECSKLPPAIHHQTIALDYLSAPYIFKLLCKTAGAKIINIKDPCIPMKARKTSSEVQAIRTAHIHDGVAIVKFLCWLDENTSGQSEISIAEKLEAFRRENPAYKGPSFPTIAGFNANGAIIHYRASAATNKIIAPHGVLLLDSGGQYLCDEYAGTTDITRTIATGEVSDEIKRQNTLVLKGHIALAMAHFPQGTTGVQIDTLARQPLWNAGLDYAHGTGHGVGCYSEVHEEAASISPRGKLPLEEGMLLSNEPGYYKEGSHGIRIENLILVQSVGQSETSGAKMLSFETVTLAPIDHRLIVAPLLSNEEKDWLNAYHARVQETLLPLLDNKTAMWLKAATQIIK